MATYLRGLYGKVYLLITDIWPKLNSLQGDLVNITFHGLHSYLQGVKGEMMISLFIPSFETELIKEIQTTKTPSIQLI